MPNVIVESDSPDELVELHRMNCNGKLVTYDCPCGATGVVVCDLPILDCGFVMMWSATDPCVHYSLIQETCDLLDRRN